MTAPLLIRLDQLKPNQLACVSHIEATDEDTERLMSLGVCMARQVQLVQSGDPLIIKVFSSRVGLSSRLAARVFVSPLPPSPEASHAD